MDDLAEHFDEKCNIIEESGSACMGSLADEQLEINRGDDIKEVVSLGQQMEYFRNLYDKKTRRLRNLWLQYRSVQQRIMELAVVVLEEDQVLVTITEVKQKEDAREDQHAKVSKQSPANNDNDAGIDEAKALEEHRIFQSCYSTALSELDDIKHQVAKVAEDVLEENKQIVKVSFAYLSHDPGSQLTQPPGHAKRTSGDEEEDKRCYGYDQSEHLSSWLRRCPIWLQSTKEQPSKLVQNEMIAVDIAISP